MTLSQFWRSHHAWRGAFTGAVLWQIGGLWAFVALFPVTFVNVLIDRVLIRREREARQMPFAARVLELPAQWESFLDGAVDVHDPSIARRNPSR